MFKKDGEIKWTADVMQSFKDIKRKITEAPVLVNPDFSRYFFYFLVLL